MACANASLHLSVQRNSDLDGLDELPIQLVIIRGWFWMIVYGLLGSLGPANSDGLGDPDIVLIRDKLLKTCINLQYQVPLPNEFSDAAQRRNLCNMVEAMYYLSSRHNSRIEDRLAIVANLCDYSVRIDTRKVQKKYFGLSTCLYTLAVLKGDLSLMVGMAHEIWDQERIPQRRHRYFSWIPPPSAHLRHFNWSFENSCTARMVSPNITQKGLTLKGFVWNINQRLFLPEVQQKYSEHSSQYLDQLEHKAMGDAYRGIYSDIFRELYKQNLPTLAVAIWRFLRILVCLPAFHIPSQLRLVGQYVH
jgi:hypothetical protein